MSDDTPRFSVLRDPAWSSLRRKLDIVRTRDRGLAASRDVLLRPLELLELMAADAPGALADDVLKADRLRMVLHLAAPFASLIDEARALGVPGAKHPAKAAAADASTIANAYEPGLIDFGALLIVALAAIRVAPHDMREVFLQTVHGLALSAAPAEVVGRLDPLQPEADALALILNTLYLLDAVGEALKSPFLGPFTADPVERARWACLSLLLDNAFFSAAIKDAGRWDGASASGIETVTPEQSWPGELVTLTGDLHYLGKGAQLPERVRVVFAAAERTPLLATVKHWKPGAASSSLIVEVPAGAAPGWIGFSDDAKLEAANKYRVELAAALEKTFGQAHWLRVARIPVEQLRPIGTADPQKPRVLLAVPPRRAGNRFLGGLPRITHAAITPPTAAGAGALLTWESVGADTVLLEPSGQQLSGSGQRAVSMLDDSSEYTLTPTRNQRRGAPVTLSVPQATPRIGSIHVSQSGRQTPLRVDAPLDVELALVPPSSTATGYLMVDRTPAADSFKLRPLPRGSEAGLRFVIPAAAVQTGLSFSAVIAENENAAPSDRRRLGPLAIDARTGLTVLLARPAILDPGMPAIALDAASAALEQAAKAIGLELTIRDLPWIDDSLAVLLEPLHSADDARIPLLLDRLARRAMLTPGFEDALCLLLLPEPPVIEPPPPPIRVIASSAPRANRTGLAVSLPSEAARAVAVADCAGLPALVRGVLGSCLQQPSPPPEVATKRLRILGTLGADLELESVQEETRGVGPGAPVQTPFTAVALDADGHERLSQPISCLRDTRPAVLAILMPVSNDISAVELRAGAQVLKRITRTLGKPQLKQVQLEPGDRLSWSYTHSAGARPDLTVALTADGVTTAVLAVDACDHTPLVPLWRFRAAEALSLSASDGWNVSVVEQPVQLAGDSQGPVVIRRVSDGQFWADVPEGWSVRWELDGRAIGEARRLRELDPRQTGTLRLQATPPSGAEPITDARWLAAEA